MTPKQRKIEQLIHDVWRQNPRCGTVSTMNPCDCGRGAVRGTGACGQCVLEELVKLTGEEAAQSYAIQVVRIREAEWKMLNGGELTPELAEDVVQRLNE